MNDWQYYVEEGDVVITLKFPDPEHSHQKYKLHSERIMQESSLLSREIKRQKEGAPTNTVSIEIQENLDHEAFDEVLKFISETGNKPNFDFSMMCELFEVAYYLEITELKADFKKKIVDDVALNKANIWNFIFIAYAQPTENGYVRIPEIGLLIKNFLKAKNYRILASSSSSEKLGRIVLEDFLEIFTYHYEDKKKDSADNKHFYLPNSVLMEIAEDYCAQKFKSRTEFKNNLKKILERIIDKDDLTEEESLAFRNFDLFIISKSHEKFKLNANQAWDELSSKIESLEREREESYASKNSAANFDSLRMDKSGIKNDLITKISTLEFDEQRQKSSLENRIEMLEEDNKKLFVELRGVFESFQDYLGSNSEEIRTKASIISQEIARIQRDESFSLVPGSKIITQKAQRTLISWIKEGRDDSGIIGKMLGGASPSRLSLFLLYQATRDGGTSKDFHSLVEGKTRTVVVIQSEHGNIFGGYSSNASWSVEADGYVTSDEKAFIFSLDHKIKLPITDPSKAIVSKSTYGPTFGAGNEIFLSGTFLVDSGSHTNINGSSYAMPKPEIGLNVETFMGGSYHFKVREVEVFQLMETV